MAFPTTPLLDDFNRANESPPTGWDYHFNAAQDGRPAPSLIDQQLGIGENNFTSAYWAAEEFGPDLEAYATLAVPPSVGNQCSIEFRLQGPGTGGTAPSDGNAYHASVCITAGATIRRIYRTDGGVYTLLNESTPGLTFTAGDQFGVRLIGDIIHTFVNGVEWGDPYEATGVTGTGYIGVTVTELGVRWDDFGGGTYVEEEPEPEPEPEPEVSIGEGESLYFVLTNSSTGARLTGVAYTAVVASYTRERAADVQVDVVELDSVSAAFTAGGWVEVDATNCPGLYRFDCPSAALRYSAGVNRVAVTIKATSALAETLVIELSADPITQGSIGAVADEQETYTEYTFTDGTVRKDFD